MSSKSSRAWLIAGLILGTVAFGAVGGIRLFRFAVSPVGGGRDFAVTVEVLKGQSPQTVLETLKQAGVLEDTESMHLLGRVTRRWGDLKAGEYELTGEMTPIQIFGILTSGVSKGLAITIAEGQNMYQIAQLLEAKGLGPRAEFLKLCKSSQFIAKLGLEPSPKTLEGYLFPDTYFFPKRLSIEEKITRMVGKFKEVWTDDFTQRAKAMGLDQAQVVTLASIIEKETGVPEERKLISSVFHNRLKKGMKLQSDPTTIYGIWERYDGNIHRKDLLEKTPYNTYAIAALPVGAISNPGKEAIEAALHPDSSPYLFFVSKNDGTHVFTSKFEDHSTAVKKFQLDRKAREGKSWRDRLKQPPGT